MPIKRANSLVVWISLGLLVVFFVGGLMLSQRKRLWNDELYSQLTSVQMPYSDILGGKIPEGNVSPLFYVGQKAWTKLIHYQPREEWSSNWGYNHPYSNVVLRIPAVLCMSTAVVLIFYYFAQFYSLWAGFYALAVALSSFMVWAYGFEARHYALWFLLTTAQTICFLRMVQNPKAPRLWIALALIHTALAFTVFFSAIQISSACLLLWMFQQRDWKKYIWLFVIPIAIIGFYYTHAPKYRFWFAEGFMKLIGASISLDRLGLMALFGLFWAFSWGTFKGWWKELKWLPSLPSENLKVAGLYGALTGLVLAGCFAVLFQFKIHQMAKMDGFQISNRYFLCLAPLGIFATTLFSLYAVQSQKGIVKFLIIVALVALLLLRIDRTIFLVNSLHMF
jgi:hypothetical protein